MGRPPGAIGAGGFVAAMLQELRVPGQLGVKSAPIAPGTGLSVPTPRSGALRGKVQKNDYQSFF
jgi:hypothetical protein